MACRSYHRRPRISSQQQNDESARTHTPPLIVLYAYRYMNEGIRWFPEIFQQVLCRKTPAHA